MKFSIIAFSILFSISVSAEDYEKSKGVMTPLDSELLEEPIQLNKKCREINIVEWRQTPSINSTKPNEKAIKILKQTCNLVVSNFSNFISTHTNYEIKNTESIIDTSVSLMPGTDYSSQPRNLNDVKYRFFYRPKFYDDNGNLIQIWGFFQRSKNFIYIRNDVLTDDYDLNYITQTVFAHELFHAMSFKYGIYSQHEGNKDKQDEELAHEFTDYLGLDE